MLIKQNKKNRLQVEYLLLVDVDDSMMERFPKGKLRSSWSLSQVHANDRAGVLAVAAQQ
jgi:hypothetical protein